MGIPRISVQFLLSLMIVASHSAPQKPAKPIEVAWNPKPIDFFDQKEFQGERLQLQLNAAVCKEIPQDWVNRTRSINTFGECVEFYESTDCSGKEFRLDSTTQDGEDLTRVKESGGFQSMQLCRDFWGMELLVVLGTGAILTTVVVLYYLRVRRSGALQ